MKALRYSCVLALACLSQGCTTSDEQIRQAFADSIKTGTSCGSTAAEIREEIIRHNKAERHQWELAERKAKQQMDRIYTPEAVQIFRDQSRASVTLASGIQLWADAFEYKDDSKQKGKATGHVQLLVEASSSAGVSVRAYALEAEFDRNKGSVTLSGWPQLLFGKYIYEATLSETTVELNFDGKMRIRGPTRTTLPASGDLPALFRP